MKKQVVVIHGGRTFKIYRQYLQSLKTRKVDKDTFKAHGDWRSSLGKKLGKGWEVFAPRMPNGNNAIYAEWKIWFERMNSFSHHNVILIGHSLGGIFLVKYLAENICRKKVKALILVAAPFSECTDEPLGKFVLPKSLRKLSNQVNHIYIVHSKDDPVVSFSETAKYKKALPQATIFSFNHKQHFNKETFPEMVTLIKKIWR